MVDVDDFFCDFAEDDAAFNFVLLDVTAMFVRGLAGKAPSLVAGSCYGDLGVMAECEELQQGGVRLQPKR